MCQLRRVKASMLNHSPRCPGTVEIVRKLLRAVCCRWCRPLCWSEYLAHHVAMCPEELLECLRLHSKILSYSRKGYSSYELRWLSSFNSRFWGGIPDDTEWFPGAAAL
ncbi:hypothetical protein CEXT_212801 [Caerostris extrusa]|uniref:Uncharacterized protein n=1 Tax=Caerostris extrusa TaxID=172846 RepID=A0AAV4TF41_CAEEX|nr:hypothetical protein CEXT_212801 [Caerostris extrusa]